MKPLLRGLFVAWHGTLCLFFSAAALAAPTADERFVDEPAATLRPAPVVAPPMTPTIPVERPSDMPALRGDTARSQSLDAVIELQGRSVGLDFSPSSRPPVAETTSGARSGAGAHDGAARQDLVSDHPSIMQTAPVGRSRLQPPYGVVLWLRDNRWPVAGVALLVTGAMVWVSLKKRPRRR